MKNQSFQIWRWQRLGFQGLQFQGLRFQDLLNLWGGGLWQQQPDAIAPEQLGQPLLELKKFVDVYHDISGWHAFGHHKPKTFLRALAQQEPQRQFSPNQVIHTWATPTGNSNELFIQPHSQSQPVTLIITSR